MAHSAVRHSPEECALLATATWKARIDVQNARELRHWCEKLQASEEEWRRAVDQVGPDAEKVREHLFGGFTSGGPTS